MGGDRNRLVSRLEDERGGRAELMRAAAAYLKSEPERLAAAHSEGRQEERAAVVAWLRNEEALNRKVDIGGREEVSAKSFAIACMLIADAIEQGQFAENAISSPLSRDGIGDG